MVSTRIYVRHDNNPFKKVHARKDEKNKDLTETLSCLFLQDGVIVDSADVLRSFFSSFFLLRPRSTLSVFQSDGVNFERGTHLSVLSSPRRRISLPLFLCWENLVVEGGWVGKRAPDTTKLAT